MFNPDDEKVRVIAEVGGNWRVGNDTESRTRAEELIHLAAGAGAWAIKFQLLKGEKLHKTQAAKVKPYELPEAWLPALARKAQEEGIEFMVSPYYLEAVDAIDPWVRYHKIDSWDITYAPLVKKVGKTGKPVFVGTGGATMMEISDAILWLTGEKDPDERAKKAHSRIVLMHSSGGYPTEYRYCNLKTILDLWETFLLQVGYSVHHKHLHIAAAAALLHVNYFQLHFTAKQGEGIDAPYSYTPTELQAFIEAGYQVKKAWDCGCEITPQNQYARDFFYRNPEDWLRPALRQ